MTLLFLPTLLSWLPLVSIGISLLGIPGLYLAFRKGVKDLQKEREQAIRDQTTKEVKAEEECKARDKDYHLFQTKVEERMTGFNQALERVADKASEDCKALDSKIGGLQSLSTEVTKLQTTTDGTNSRVEKVETSLEKLENRLNSKLENLDAKLDRKLEWQGSILNEILLHLNGGGRKLPNP